MRMILRQVKQDSIITAISQFLQQLMKMVMKLLPEYGRIELRM